MNFNDLYKKIADLDKPVAEDAQVENCGGGMPMSPPPAEPSMSVNLNAQGLDHIADILKLIAKVNPDAAKPDMPELTIAPGISAIKSLDDKPSMPPGISAIKSLDKKPPMLPDLSDEKDDMDSKKEKEEGFQDATTEPDPEYQDTDYMVNKLSGGLGKQQTMRKHGYKHGDNPLSMESVEEIKESLSKLYQEYKGQ